MEKQVNECFNILKKAGKSSYKDAVVRLSNMENPYATELMRLALIRLGVTVELGYIEPDKNCGALFFRLSGAKKAKGGRPDAFHAMLEAVEYCILMGKSIKEDLFQSIDKRLRDARDGSPVPFVHGIEFDRGSWRIDFMGVIHFASKDSEYRFLFMVAKLIGVL